VVTVATVAVTMVTMLAVAVTVRAVAVTSDVRGAVPAVMLSMRTGLSVPSVPDMLSGVVIVTHTVRDHSHMLPLETCTHFCQARWCVKRKITLILRS
jgi:hypothetical protein